MWYLLFNACYYFPDQRDEARGGGEGSQGGHQREEAAGEGQGQDQGDRLRRGRGTGQVRKRRLLFRIEQI